jgi:hypothetical protein
MGVALLVGDDLIRADVERLRDTGMTPKEVAEKGKLVLRRWIERYRPDVLAVEDAYFAQSKGSRPLRRLIVVDHREARDSDRQTAERTRPVA